MKKELENLFKEIKELEFSNDSLLDLINFIDKAIEISKTFEPNRNENQCLNHLVQTKQKQLAELLEHEGSVEDRKKKFEKVKEEIATDKGFCV